MNDKSPVTGKRSRHQTPVWPVRAILKWNLLVVLAIVLVVQVPLWLRGFGNEIVGEVVDAYVQIPTSGRGMRVPYVRVVFRYSWKGTVHSRLELFDPRQDWSSNWGEEEHQTANAFIAKHARGTPVTVWVPRLVPWEGTIVPALKSEGSRHIERWFVTAFFVTIYSVSMATALSILYRMHRWWRARGGSSA